MLFSSAIRGNGDFFRNAAVSCKLSALKGCSTNSTWLSASHLHMVNPVSKSHPSFASTRINLSVSALISLIICWSSCKPNPNFILRTRYGAASAIFCGIKFKSPIEIVKDVNGIFSLSDLK